MQMMSAISRIVLSFLASFVAHVFFVVPLSHLEVLLLPRKKVAKDNKVDVKPTNESQPVAVA